MAESANFSPATTSMIRRAAASMARFVDASAQRGQPAPAVFAALLAAHAALQVGGVRGKHVIEVLAAQGRTMESSQAQDS